VWSVGDSVTAPEHSYDKMFSIQNLRRGMEEMLELLWDKEMEFFKTLFCHLV